MGKSHSIHILLTHAKYFLFTNLFLLTGCNEPPLRTYAITLRSIDFPLPSASISTTYSLTCNNVLGGSTNFTQSSITVTGTTGSIQILQNVNCTMTITSFFDGTSVYNPTSLPLAITISATGVVTSSGSLTDPPSYQSGSGTTLYLFMASGTSSNISLEYAFNPAALTTSFISSGVTCTNGNCSSSAPNQTIQQNFNNVAIASGNYLWFSSAFTVTGINPLVTTRLYFTNSVIVLTNGTTYTIDLPESIVTFAPTTLCGSTTISQNTWQTNLPSSGSIISGNLFLSGIGWRVPVNIPAALKRITWQGQFYADQPGVNVTWKWAAAVYNTDMTNGATLGVKSAATGDCTYINTDNPGTPENKKANLLAGGTGNGGTNYTGTYSATSSTPTTNCTPSCSTSGYMRCPLICTPGPVRPP